MIRQKFVIITLFFILFLNIYPAIYPDEAFSQSHNLQFNRPDTRDKVVDGAISPDSRRPSIRKWLMLFGSLAGLALLFLLIFEIGGGGLFPDDIENIITKVCIGVIAIALWLFLYYISSKAIFLIFIPLTIVSIIYMYMHNFFRSIYIKRFGKPTSSDSWICRNCGSENSNLLIECSMCNTKKSPEKTVTQKETWTCTNCNYENSADDKSCRRCGMRREGV